MDKRYVAPFRSAEFPVNFTSWEITRLVPGPGGKMTDQLDRSKPVTMPRKYLVARDAQFPRAELLELTLLHDSFR